MLSCQFDWWVDHTYSNVLGARITTNVECGSILITLLTLAVSLTGTAVWTIVAYAMFQLFVSRYKIEAFRAQIQLILVNPTGSFSDWWNFIQMGWSWRQHKTRAAGIFFALSFVPLLFFLGFSASQIAVAKVTLPGYEANKYPATGGTCGMVLCDLQDLESNIIWSSHVANDTKLAQNYKNLCYHKAYDPVACPGFVKQELKYTPSLVECPWEGEGACTVGKAYQLDTNWIDSHTDLGINAIESDRIQVRKVTTCSVINTAKYLNITTDPLSNGDYDIWEFYFGQPLNVDSTGQPTYNGVTLSWTYRRLTADALVPYLVYPFQFLQEGIGRTGAAPELDRPDGDLTLIGLAAGRLQYLNPNIDPYFHATQNFTSNAGDTTHLADTPMQVMACLDQTQYRNPNNDQETPLQGIFDSNIAMYQLGYNHAQNATAKRTWGPLWQSSTFSNIAGLGETALAANSGVWRYFSVGLPDNQWQIEVANWFDIGLAKFQQYMVDYVENPWVKYAEASDYITIVDPGVGNEGDEKEAVQQCYNQLVSGVALRQTFSALGVGIIAVAAPLFVIISLFLAKIVRKCAGPHKKYSDLAYRKQNVLRMALESKGYDGWIETHHEIPVREDDDADIPPPAFKNGHVDIPSAPHRLSFNTYAGVNEPYDVPLPRYDAN